MPTVEGLAARGSSVVRQAGTVSRSRMLPRQAAINAFANRTLRDSRRRSRALHRSADQAEHGQLMTSTGTRRRSMIAALPEWVKAPLRRIRTAASRIPHYGVGRWCPVCERESRRFQPTRQNGIVSLDARCMYCGALPRHRLAWRFFAHHTDLFDERPKRMLHVVRNAASSLAYGIVSVAAM